MAKTYIDTAQIVHSVGSEYQRERGSRENTQQRRSVKEGERMERKENSCQITVKHLYENNCAEFQAYAV